MKDNLGGTPVFNLMIHTPQRTRSVARLFSFCMLAVLTLSLLTLNACGPQTTDPASTQPSDGSTASAENPEDEKGTPPPSRRHFLDRMFNPDGDEPEVSVAPWDEQKFIEDNNINTLEEIEPRAIGFHVMMHNLVMPRPSDKLHAFVKNLDTPKSIPPAMVKAWERNGYVLRAVPNDQLDFFFANLPDIISRNSEPILPTGTAVPIDLLNVRNGATLLFVNDDSTITPVELSKGTAQMHIKLLPPLRKQEIAPVLSLVPHFHGFNSLTFRAPTARDRATIGTTFDELRIRAKLPKNEAWVLLAQAHKPLESEEELRERLTKEKLYRNRTTVPHLYANGQSLAQLTLHALQGVAGEPRKVQRLMIIAPQWPAELLEEEENAEKNENTPNTEANTTQPDTTDSTTTAPGDGTE